jgi:myosin heavy subunit
MNASTTIQSTCKVFVLEQERYAAEGIFFFFFSSIEFKDNQVCVDLN